MTVARWRCSRVECREWFVRTTVETCSAMAPHAVPRLDGNHRGRLQPRKQVHDLYKAGRTDLVLFCFVFEIFKLSIIEFYNSFTC